MPDAASDDVSGRTIELASSAAGSSTRSDDKDEHKGAHLRKKVSFVQFGGVDQHFEAKTKERERRELVGEARGQLVGHERVRAAKAGLTASPAPREVVNALALDG